MDNKKLIPVLTGADLNCYNIARAFHEEYGVKSHAFARYSIGATKYTKIINFHEVPDFDNPSIFIETLNAFARDIADDSALILFGCTDDYVSLIVRNKEMLSDKFIIPYIGKELMDDLTLKEHFYRNYCEKYGLLYPKTTIFEKGQTKFDIDFDYPIIIKPSSSTLYWHFPFDGMKKVYRAKDETEAREIINSIYASGYPEKLILQDTIPGDDIYMYVLTAYCDRQSKVRMMCLGHVLLEEHTPKGLGNHAAIITEYNPELMEQFKTFLEEIKFVGYANFDIKYDERDGSMRLFEINTRLGRSNYYVTASGNNVVKYIVDDFVDGKPYDGCLMNKNIVYWRYIPDGVVYDYVSDKYKKIIKQLIKDDKAYSSMRYKFDLRMNLKRRLFIIAHEYNHRKKYKKYYKI